MKAAAGIISPEHVGALVAHSTAAPLALGAPFTGVTA